jgi:hypothetical protein
MTITTVQDPDSLANAAEAENTRRALHHLAIELVQRDEQIARLCASLVEQRKPLDTLRAHNQAQSVALAAAQKEEKKLQAECARLLELVEGRNERVSDAHMAIAELHRQLYAQKVELEQKNEELRRARRTKAAKATKARKP